MSTVSYGLNCGSQGAPGIYTKVSKIADWVYNQTEGEAFSDIRFCGNVLNNESNKDANLTWESELGWTGSNCKQDLEFELENNVEKPNRGGIYPTIDQIYTPYNSVGRNFYMGKEIMPVNSTFGRNFAIEFEIKAVDAAHLHLCELNKCIELVIGGNLNAKSVIRARPGDDSTILAKKFGHILDKDNYVAFKLVFNQLDTTTMMSIYTTENPIYQPRNEDGFIIDESFEIKYQQEPWMQINDFFASPDIEIVNGIDNIGFATGSDGYWNILKRTDVDDCEGVICNGFAECIDGLNAYSCRCQNGITGVGCDIYSSPYYPEPYSPNERRFEKYLQSIELRLEDPETTGFEIKFLDFDVATFVDGHCYDWLKFIPLSSQGARTDYDQLSFYDGLDGTNIVQNGTNISAYNKSICGEIGRLPVHFVTSYDKNGTYNYDPRFDHGITNVKNNGSFYRSIVDISLLSIMTHTR